MTTVEILTKARAKIADPKNWVQGRDQNPHNAPIQWAAFGAILDVTREDWDGLFPARKIMQSVCEGNISLFNDTHTHSEVLAAFDKAIELAKEAA